MFVWCFFFFKQKTAYEMRISDWSSDVCSSDLSFCGLQRAAILADTAFDFRAEMLDQPLDRPCGGVAERTDGVAFDLLGDVEQSVDLAYVGVAGPQPLHHAPHPAGALAARGALAAAFMLVEIADAADRLHDVERTSTRL